MKILVVFESLFGNSHKIAEAVADGLKAARPEAEVELVHVGSASAEQVASAELLVVGGPTHNLGMSTAATRQKGVELAQKSDQTSLLEPKPTDVGLREWLSNLPASPQPTAAFCTHTSGMFAGSAAKGYARLLKSKGHHLIDKPANFGVTGLYGPLADRELDRARQWGIALIGLLK